MCRSEPFQDTKFKINLKTLGTCETICGNSGCPIVTLGHKVMGLVMIADGTSREIIALETVLLSLQKHLHELVSIH
jgi:hypothetical protein